MEWIQQNPTEVVLIAILVLENILPYLPTKANSTVQVLINILKHFGKKKG